MPQVDDKPTTHYPGCWREHHECAIRLIERAEKIMEADIDGALVILSDDAVRVVYKDQSQWLRDMGYLNAEQSHEDGTAA